jgi:hypothetical protein
VFSIANQFIETPNGKDGSQMQNSTCSRLILPTEGIFWERITIEVKLKIYIEQ